MTAYRCIACLELIEARNANCHIVIFDDKSLKGNIYNNFLIYTTMMAGYGLEARARRHGYIQCYTLINSLHIRNDLLDV